jgi:threonine/homoserine efflux transporter RhtA
VLGERLAARQLLAIVLVAAASAGASRGASEAAPRDA